MTIKGNAGFLLNGIRTTSVKPTFVSAWKGVPITTHPIVPAIWFDRKRLVGREEFHSWLEPTGVSHHSIEICRFYVP
jgi:hypothetical protein